MKTSNSYLLMGGIIVTLTGLALITSQSSSANYQAPLIAQGTIETATPVVPTDTNVQNNLDDSKNTLKWDKENYQNRSNELKSNFKGQNVDLSNLTNLMAQWNSLLTQMESAVNSGDTTQFNDLNTQEDDLSRDISDAFTAAYDESNLANSKTQALKEKPKQLKDIERQLKDLQRNSRKIQPAPDTSVLQGYISTLQDLINKMQTLANTPTGTADARDLSDSISDLIRDFDDTSQDFYNTINELNETVNNASQLENSQRNLKDKTRTVKDLKREIKRISKNITQEQAQLLVTKEQEINEILTQIQNAITAGDVETANDLDRDFWDKNTEIQDLLQESRDTENRTSQTKDMARIVKEKTRNLKDANRQCTEVKCENTDSGATLKQLEDLLNQMTAMADNPTGDFTIEDFWDLNSQFDEINGEFWQLIQTKHSEKDLRRWLKDIAREVKDKGRWVADLEREAKRGQAPFSAGEVDKLQSIYDVMVEVSKNAETAYNNGDFETAQDLLNIDYNDLRAQFDNITNNFNKGREEEFFNVELENVLRELQNAEQIIPELLDKGEITEEKANLCSEYVNQGYQFYEELKAVQEQGQIGESAELQARFEKLGNKADRDCGDIFGDNSGDYKGFTEVYIDEEFRGTADDVFNRVSDEVVNRLIDKLMNDASTSNLFNTILEKVGQRFEEQLARTMENFAFLEQSYTEELLSRKAVIMEKVDKLDEKIAKEIVDYNFIGKAGDKLEEALQKGSITSKEVASLKEEARVEKFEAGYIPFRDVDDTDWYLRFVKDARDKGIVSGYKNDQGPTGYFGPGDNVTYAQALKMTMEAAGYHQEPNNDKIWYQVYLNELDNLELSRLDSKTFTNWDAPATRGNIVLMVNEIFGIEPVEYVEGTFPDVEAGDKIANDAMASYLAGVFTGEGETGKLNPNNNINRAGFAKVINIAIEAMETGDNTGIFSANDDEEFEDEEEIPSI